MDNLLRMLVKTDNRTMQEIADLAGVHRNTMTTLTRSELSPVDKRVKESIEKVAGIYNLGVRFKVEFFPLDGNGNQHSQ